MKRIAILLGAVAVWFGGVANASPHRPSRAGAARRAVQAPGKAAAASHHRRHKRQPRPPRFSGRAVSPAELQPDPQERPSGHLHLFSINGQQELTVELYDQDGALSEAALDELNHFFRCRRTETEKPIEPRLFETLSRISDHFGGARIELVSGFRNQARESSYHYLGTASDIRVEGVPPRALQKYLTTLDSGHQGLGLYPHGGFIHVDIRPTSYRWTDWSGPHENKGFYKRARRPNS